MNLLKIDLPNIGVTNSVLRLSLAVHIRPWEPMASAMPFHACIRPPPPQAAVYCWLLKHMTYSAK